MTGIASVKMPEKLFITETLRNSGSLLLRTPDIMLRIPLIIKHTKQMKSLK